VQGSSDARHLLAEVYGWFTEGSGPLTSGRRILLKAGVRGLVNALHVNMPLSRHLPS
jgi:hypothetical protein